MRHLTMNLGFESRLGDLRVVGVAFQASATVSA